jgi:hypothetical protein
MFRLHIDIPLPYTEEEAAKMAKDIIASLNPDKLDGYCINYRLGHDEDRQKSNYLDKNENGHVSNKKSKILFIKDSQAISNIQLNDELTAVDDVV